MIAVDQTYVCTAVLSLVTLVHIWFLKLLLFMMLVCTCVYLFPRLVTQNEAVLTNLSTSTTFLLLYMTLAISYSSMDGHGISNDVCHECLVKETKVTL